MENIFTASEPFLRFGKVLGYFPHNFEGPARKGFFRTAWSGLLLFCVIITSFVCINTFHMMDRTVIVTSSKIASNGWMITTDLAFSTHLAILLYQFYKRETVATFLKQIYDIDEDVRISLTQKAFRFTCRQA